MIFGDKTLTTLARKWTTADEIAYIDGIGRHFSRSTRMPTWLTRATRVQRLKSYQNVMRARSRWGAVDAVAIGTHVASEIDRAGLQ